MPDDSFVLLFNAHAEDREFTLPRRRFGALAGSSCAPPTRPPRRGASATAPHEVNVIAHSITILKRPRDLGPAAIELRATYRLQLTSEFGFAAARELIPYLRDLGIAPVPVAVAAGPPRLHPRLRRRRPAQLSGELGGPEELGALSYPARRLLFQQRDRIRAVRERGCPLSVARPWHLRRAVRPRATRSSTVRCLRRHEDANGPTVSAVSRRSGSDGPP